METAGDTSKSLSSKTRPEGHIPEAETQIPNFSIIKQVDNARLLPRYTASKCFSIANTIGHNTFIMFVLNSTQSKWGKWGGNGGS